VEDLLKRKEEDESEKFMSGAYFVTRWKRGSIIRVVSLKRQLGLIVLLFNSGPLHIILKVFLSLNQN
jgi:hypothetical protein